MDEQEKKIIKWAILSSPGCALPLFIVIIIAVFISLGLINNSSSNKGEICKNIQGVDEICSSIAVAGYGTMSVDEYVAGVVQNEYGGANIEVKKALAIAARSYGLNGATKNSDGSCYIGNTSEGFQTYNSSPNESSIQAAEETSGMILVDENNNVARSEYSSCSLPEPYDSYGSTLTMSERDYTVSKEKFNKYRPGTACESNSTVNSKNSNTDWKGRAVYGSGHGRGMGQLLASYLVGEENYTYEQLIEFFYGKDSTYNWSLASTKGATTNCTSTNNGNLQTLSEYNLNGNGLKVLDRTLTSSEIQELNDYIDSETDKAGYGTGAGIAAAAQSLIYWMEQKGYFISYYWAGGHESNFVGASSNWGSTKFGIDTNNGNYRPYYGMDCSGFVSWVTRTACNVNFGVKVSGDWVGLGNTLSSLENAKPGDVLADDGHIQLVVKNNGDGTVIVAEEKGGNVGLVFNKVSSTSKKIIDMSQYYNNNCNTSR